MNQIERDIQRECGGDDDCSGPRNGPLRQRSRSGSLTNRVKGPYFNAILSPTSKDRLVTI